MGMQDIGSYVKLNAKLQVADIDLVPLDKQASRAAGAARVADMARQFKELNLELGAIQQGGAVIDLLNAGVGKVPGRSLGNHPAGQEGYQPGLSGPEDKWLNVGLPRNQRHRSAAGLGVPDPRDAMRGAASYGGTRPAPTPVPGQSNSIVEPGGKWHTGLMTDGTRISAGEGWRDGSYHIFTTTETATGETKTTTVIVATDGRSATFTDVSGGTNNPRTTATGDPTVIATEQQRRAEGGGSEFDPAPPTQQPERPPQEEPEESQEPARPEPLPPSQPRDTPPQGPITISVDPDAPNQPNYWGNYNPFTGQYWGPARKLDNNQVNPGRDNTAGTPTGPKLTIDPKDVVINPDYLNAPGPGQPKLTSSQDGQVGPGGRPPKFPS